MRTDIGIMALVLAGMLFCLAIFLECNTRHARRLGESTHRYTAASILGWLFGMFGAAGGAVLLGFALEARRVVPDWLAEAIVIGASQVGALAGASIGYIWLRLATKKDPDYGELPAGTGGRVS